jgi:hypothetical protein
MFASEQPGNLLCFLVWGFAGWSCSFFISGDSAKEKRESFSVYLFPTVFIFMLSCIHLLFVDTVWLYGSEPNKTEGKCYGEK